MNNDCIEKLLIHLRAYGRALFPLDRDDWLKGFEGLNGSLEADRTWLSIMFECSLRDDRSN